MTMPRESQISLESTRYYHCVNRCVRRAWLCGEDPHSGRDFSYRKQWIVEYLKFLGTAFSIRIAAYAIMSNHYHLVLYVDLEQAQKWEQEEVKERWRMLFKHAVAQDEEQVEEWRRRLTDISWFMRCLNETIAREANKEDQCKGRFWESRFKCQALLDEGALLACMTYVDLNPIRSQLAETPEDSDFTSIQERIRQLQEQNERAEEQTVPTDFDIPSPLMSFQNNPSDPNQEAQIPISQTDYLLLLEWTGSRVRLGKKGKIPPHLTPILQRLKLNPDRWFQTTQTFHQAFFRAVGSPGSLKIMSENVGAVWLKGQRNPAQVYLDAA